MVKPEEMSIEEYWDLFKDTLPGSESTVEVVYRILEVLTRQMLEFSEHQERDERYPELITKRIRNPDRWQVSLKYWNHTEGDFKNIVGADQVYSKAVAVMFERILKALTEEKELRLRWVKDAELTLAELMRNYRLTEGYLRSLGTYVPEQPNLPFPKKEEP